MAPHRALRQRFTRSRIGVSSVLLLALFAAGLVFLGQAPPLLAAGPDGQAIFQQKCASCHTIGGGPLAGPDLKGVADKRDHAWLLRFIATPDKVIAEKDATVLQLMQQYSNIPMPNMGLTEADAAAVVAFLGGGPAGAAVPQGQAAGQPAAAPAAQPPPAALPVGDPAIGRALFLGTLRFQNGGAPCVACHEVAGSGGLAGGSLGPDLTRVASKYGDAGLASVLAGLPFPTMRPLYAGQPLTPAEQAHLKAFFQAPAAPPVAEPVGQLALMAVAGFLFLMMVAQLIWQRRLPAVRAPLVRAAIKQRRVAR